MPPLPPPRVTVPSPVDVAEADWEPGEFRIWTVSKGWIDTDGLSLDGLVVVHPSWDKDGLWSVTHAGSGYRILSVNEDTEALKAGELILEACRAAMEQTDKVAARSLLPKWVMPWARACDEAGVCLDPGPFREKHQ